MSRALAPWLLPAAILVGLLVAATGSVIVYVMAGLLVGLGGLPLAYSLARRGGGVRWLEGDDPERWRFPGMRPPG